jgi:hypothetical protein
MVTQAMLAVLFLSGLYISILYHPLASIPYILLWLASYLVLFAGTCRHCVYYGKACPVPLEGSMVCHVFPKSGKPFGWPALFFATIAYILRIGIPVVVLVQKRLLAEGIVFGLVFILFWAVHLFISGCPNCMNYPCPLNPGKPE